MSGPIVVVNPNSNQAVTNGLNQALAPFRLDNGPEIECLPLAEGPFGIESQVHSDQVVMPLVDLVSGRPDATAVVIACSSDPGISTLILSRKLTINPRNIMKLQAEEAL